MFDRLKKIFSKEQPKQRQSRSFKNARNSRFTTWLNATFAPINFDIRNDLRELVIKSRDLCKNNEIVQSHLNNLEKSIIGSEGFRLQSFIKDADGKLDKQLNKELEFAWYNFGKRTRGNIEKSGQLGDIDLDILILRTLLIDGEVFIRIDRKAKNKYGISFELLDSLCIDFNKNQLESSTQNAIIAGVQVDSFYRPIKYYYQPGNKYNYQVGEVEEIPAKDIIHIYKKDYVGQTRGVPVFASSLGSLKQLDDYAVAQLFAAKVGACLNLFYERNGQAEVGDVLDGDITETEQGEFISELSPGQASIVPAGYTVKSVSSSHPNSGFAAFTKAMVRKVAASLGISYNRLAHDYQAVSYSSLREAALDEQKTYTLLQKFLIDNWKNIEFQLFLKSYLINITSSNLKPSKYESYLQQYAFIARKEAYFDIAKEIVASERKLKLGISNPILEMRQFGLDPQEVLDGWTVWNNMCTERGLNFSQNKEDLPLDAIQKFNAESNITQTEILENQD